MSSETREQNAGGPVIEIISPCRREPDLGPWFPPRDAADVRALQALGVKVSLADVRPGDWTRFEFDMAEHEEADDVSDFGCLLCPDAGDPTVEASKLSDSGV